MAVATEREYGLFINGATAEPASGEVRELTGFEPGAVAPFPVPRGERVFIERTLLAHDFVWIGAGSPRHMAALPTPELVRLTKAAPADLIAAD